ncbi:MAG: SPOR domain-containing protein [Saprospiraceae bacterium]|nr:SPOR domain-containing protein [Saprospiraceae bacterium]
MDLVRYIRELLYTNNKVIIPGIGGFVSTYESANIHFMEAQIYPPSKTIKFDPNLTDNDGLLVNYIVQNEKLTYKKAYDEVKAFVGRVENVLKEQSFIEFEAIGKLYWDSEKQLAFKNQGTNFRLESFGLPILNCQPILRSKAAAIGTATLAVVEGKRVSKGGIMVLLKQPKKAVTLGGLLILFLLSPIIYSYWGSDTNLSKDPNNTQNAAIFSVNTTDGSSEDTSQVVAFSDLSKTDSSSQDTKSNHTALVDTTSRISIAENALDTTRKSSTTEPKPKLDPTPKESTVKKAYIIIVGAFEDKKNADRILRKLKKDGYTTDYKKLYTGLLRVGVLLETKAEVKKHLSRMRRKYSSDAWVITR